MPVSESFGTKRFCGCLVDDFETFVFEVVEESADCQFHYYCLATSCWCREDYVVVAIVDSMKGFGLDGVEQWEREQRAIVLRYVVHGNEDNSLG